MCLQWTSYVLDIVLFFSYYFYAVMVIPHSASTCKLWTSLLVYWDLRLLQGGFCFRQFLATLSLHLVCRQQVFSLVGIVVFWSILKLTLMHSMCTQTMTVTCSIREQVTTDNLFLHSTPQWLTIPKVPGFARQFFIPWSVWDSVPWSLLHLPI